MTAADVIALLQEQIAAVRSAKRAGPLDTKSAEEAQNLNPRTPGALPSVRRRVGVRK